MGKEKSGKRSSGKGSTPYSKPASKPASNSSSSSSSGSNAGPRSLGPTLNKDFGQHILKNPLVVNGIIQKVLYFISFFFLKKNCLKF